MQNLGFISVMVSWLGYLTAGYAVTSAFFFCFPTLLRPRKKYANPILEEATAGRKIMRISHRGGPRLTTQNTIEAFKKTVHVSDCLEMDVCETKDGVLVVHHDPSLMRTCGVAGNISEYNYADLPGFQDQIKIDFAVNTYIPSNNQKIPTLEKVFQIFQGTLLDIELKTPTKSAQKEFARLIREYNRQDSTIVGIRNDQSQVFRFQNPDILTFFNDVSTFKLLGAYFCGLAPFVNFNDVSLQVPVYSKEFLDWNLQRSKPQLHFKVKVAMQCIRLMNFVCRPLLWHFKRRGLITMAWVCNTEESMERAVKAGFQGIMTDQPFLLNSYLNGRQGQSKVA